MVMGFETLTCVGFFFFCHTSLDVEENKLNVKLLSCVVNCYCPEQQLGACLSALTVPYELCFHQHFPVEVYRAVGKDQLLKM